MQKEFKLTEQELKDLLFISRPVPAIFLQCGEPTSRQEIANNYWKKLADKYNFIWDSVKPIEGKDNHYFTAECS
jgi:hypothetical protein